MINKIKIWFKKFKKDKSKSSDILDQNNDIDLDAQIPDEADIDVLLDDETPTIPLQVSAEDSAQEEQPYLLADEEQAPIVKATAESEDTPPIPQEPSESDLTENTLEKEKEEAEPTPPDFADKTAETTVITPGSEQETPDVTGEINDIHLNEKRSLKDRAQEFAQTVKNKVKNVDLQKLKNFKFPKKTITNIDSKKIDLNEKLPIKDRVHALAQTVKDKVQRIDFRKFKSFKFPKLSSSNEGSDGPSITQKINQKYNIKLPNSVEMFEKKLKKFPWQNLHNEVFYPKNRTFINKTFLILLVILTPYYFGSTIGLLLKGKPDYKNLNNNVSLDIDQKKLLTTAQITEIKNSKLFRTEKVESNNKPTNTAVGPKVCKSATKKSKLPIKLVNTIVLQDSVKSIASVQVRSSDLSDVREGDKIDNMAKVDKIDRLGIIIKNLKDGTCESIDNTSLTGLEKSPIAVMSKNASRAFVSNKKIEGIENEGNTFKIQKSFLKSKMQNISDILTQARGIQIPNPDGSMSFKIVDVEPGGIFAYLGIQNNDVITHIGGKKIEDLNEVMNLFGKISNLDQLKITINRGGEEVPLEYNLQ